MIYKRKIFLISDMNLSMEELRERSKKDYYFWFSKFMHHNLLYVTRILLKTNITPNQITMFWLTIQLLGSFLMVLGTYKFNLIGLALYTLAAILDYIDGQIARIKKITSYKGMFLEELGLYFGTPLFLLGLSIGTSIALNNNLFFTLGIISVLSILYSQLAITDPFYYPESLRENVVKLKQKLSTRSKNKIVVNLFLILRRSNPLNLMAILIIFNLPQWVFYIYTPIYVIKMFRTLYIQFKGLHRFDKEMAAKNTIVKTTSVKKAAAKK